MPDYLPWDIDNPAHRRGRRRPPPPLEGEILTPESEPTVRVHIHHHHRSGILPQQWVLIIIALVVLRYIKFIGIALLVLLALLVTHPTIGIIFAIWLAASTGIVIWDRRRRRPRSDIPLRQAHQIFGD